MRNDKVFCNLPRWHFPCFDSSTALAKADPQTWQVYGLLSPWYRLRQNKILLNRHNMHVQCHQLICELKDDVSVVKSFHSFVSWTNLWKFHSNLCKNLNLSLVAATPFDFSKVQQVSASDSRKIRVKTHCVKWFVKWNENLTLRLLIVWNLTP